MLPDRVSNPGPLTYESGALPIALRGPAFPYDHITGDHVHNDITTSNNRNTILGQSIIDYWGAQTSFTGAKPRPLL